MPTLQVRLVHPNAVVPAQAHADDAGFDLGSAIEIDIAPESVGTTQVPVGIQLGLPKGFFGIMAPRSSASRRGLRVFTTIVDGGYVGDIAFTAAGLRDTVRVAQGERIAQLVLVRQEVIDIEVVEEIRLESRDGRGSRGFGSSGRSTSATPRLCLFCLRCSEARVFEPASRANGFAPNGQVGWRCCTCGQRRHAESTATTEFRSPPTQRKRSSPA